MDKKVVDISSDLANGYTLIDAGNRANVFKFVGIMTLMVSALMMGGFALSILSNNFNIWSTAVAQWYVDK